MKALIRKLSPGYLIFSLKELKRRYLPGETDRIVQEREKTAAPKRRRLFSTIVGKNELCFDVGANIGNRIAPLLEIGARVVAVEPQKSCYRYLEHKFGNRIMLETRGLGQREGEADFYVSDAPELSSFSSEWVNTVKQQRFRGFSWNKTEKIKMTTLDKLIAQYGVPAFIKIDVEGYELEVLKGLSQPIRMISYEYTVPENTEGALACLEVLEKLDPNIQCNYCVGEDMVYCLPEWLSAEAMKQHIREDAFQQTGFGDIYVRSKT